MAITRERIESQQENSLSTRPYNLMSVRMIELDMLTFQWHDTSISLTIGAISWGCLGVRSPQHLIKGTLYGNGRISRIWPNYYRLTMSCFRGVVNIHISIKCCPKLGLHKHQFCGLCPRTVIGKGCAPPHSLSVDVTCIAPTLRYPSFRNRSPLQLTDDECLICC